MDNVRNSIWSNANMKEADIIFGLYYEFHNSIVYNGIVKHDVVFGRALDKKFIDYINSNDIENIGYKELFNNFIDYILNEFNIEESDNILSAKRIFMIDVNSFREDVNNIDEIFPWINIINKLDLSYYNKSELNRIISNYLSYTFDILNTFYDEDTMINIQELIINNVTNYLSNINGDSFSFELFNNEFYDNNRRFINSLIKDNKFDILNLNNNDEDVNYIKKILNKDEYKIFIGLIRESLIYGDSDKLETDSFTYVNSDLKMNKLKFYYRLKSLSSKLKEDPKIKRKIR